MAEQTNYASLIAGEIATIVKETDQAQVQALVDAILGARRIFVGGVGRSGFMMSAFAMRLMHVGLESYVVGETVTPSIEPGDALIVGTGSGRTRTTFAITEAAAARGARICVLTAHPEGTIAQLADCVVHIHAPVMVPQSERRSAQPPGSLFEQCLLVTCEGLIMSLVDRLGTTEEQMRARHTKLE
jgi:6-phospho-3-hexuloisomerase